MGEMTEKFLKKYYQYVSRGANRELLGFFRESVKLRYECMDGGWKDRVLINKIEKLEGKYTKKIRKMLTDGKIVTRDDFFRAAHFFQHSLKIEDYAMAATLYSISGFLGDDWGKNHQALAVDRFLLSIHQKQIFGTQYERHGDAWQLSDYRKDIANKLRKEHDVPNLCESIKSAKHIS